MKKSKRLLKRLLKGQCYENEVVIPTFFSADNK